MDNEKEKLESIELKKDDDGYFLKLSYIRENNRGVYRGTIPHMILPIPIDSIPIINRNISVFGNDYSVDLGSVELLDGEVELLNGKRVTGAYIYETLSLKEKEVTMEDIEKKFGCKVKIVNKED